MPDKERAGEEAAPESENVAAPVRESAAPKLVLPVVVNVLNAPVEGLLDPTDVPLIEPPVAVKVPMVMLFDPEERVRAFPVVAPLVVMVLSVEVLEKVKVALDEASERSVPAFIVTPPEILFTPVVTFGGREKETMG